MTLRPYQVERKGNNRWGQKITNYTTLENAIEAARQIVRDEYINSANIWVREWYTRTKYRPKYVGKVTATGEWEPEPPLAR